MTLSYGIKYGLCFFQDDIMVSYIEVLNETEAYDFIKDNLNYKFALFAWIEATREMKMFWMIDNTVSSNRTDTQLLSRIYQEVFTYSESWRIDNA